MKNNYLCVVNLNRYTFVSIKDIRMSNFILRRLLFGKTKLSRRNLFSHICLVSEIIIIMPYLTHIFLIPPCTFRWVCTSGLAADLATTDEIARKVLEQIMAEGCEF